MSGNIGGENPQGAGKHAGVGKVVERVAEMDDEGPRGAGLLGGLVEGHQLGGFETEGADAGKEAALLDIAVDDEA